MYHWIANRLWSGKDHSPPGNPYISSLKSIHIFFKIRPYLFGKTYGRKSGNIRPNETKGRISWNHSPKPYSRNIRQAVLLSFTYKTDCPRLDSRITSLQFPPLINELSPIFITNSQSVYKKTTLQLETRGILIESLIYSIILIHQF